MNESVDQWVSTSETKANDIFSEPQEGDSLRAVGLLSMIAVLILLSCSYTWAAPIEKEADMDNSSNDIELLNAWSMPSERVAAKYLFAQMAQHGLKMYNATVNGDKSQQVSPVLYGRILANIPPDIAPVGMHALSHWHAQELIHEIAINSQERALVKSWFEQVRAVSAPEPNDKLLSIPLGIHKMNVIYYSQELFRRLQLPPPTTWDQVAFAAERLRRQSIVPMVWTDDPWQVALVFESLLLAELGSQKFKLLMRPQQPSLWKEAATAKALERLRWLQQLNRDHSQRQIHWGDAVTMVQQQQAGMLIHGNWVLGEWQFQHIGQSNDLGCVNIPGTENQSLYGLETLAFLKTNRQSRQGFQNKFTQVALNPNVISTFQNHTGAMPLMPAPAPFDPAQFKGMSDCTQTAWQAFSQSGHDRVSSHLYGLTSKLSIYKAFVNALQRFINTPQISVAAMQNELMHIVNTQTQLYANQGSILASARQYKPDALRVQFKRKTPLWQSRQSPHRQNQHDTL